MKSLVATFAVVTPCFPGGADPKASVALTTKTIKGALQFWWRALAYSRHGANIAALRAEESRIFGSSDGKIGQSKLLFSLEHEITSNLCAGAVYPSMDGKKAMLGAKYLGYGLVTPFGEHAGQLLRAGINAPVTFTLRINSKHAIDPTIIDAMKVFGLLGGLGSRSRRGFGSLSLLELKCNDKPLFVPPTSVSMLKDTIHSLVAPACKKKEEPSYSAFSALTRIEIVHQDSSALKALDYVGEQMVRYRSWGKYEKILGGTASTEKNFDDDHGWFKYEKPSKVGNNFHPRRVAFGLPQKYDNATIVKPQDHERRASPLLLHVHELTPKNYAVVLSLLASKFLPDGEMIIARKPVTPRLDNYQVLHDFFDGYKGSRVSKTKEKYFPNAIPVIPHVQP